MPFSALKLKSLEPTKTNFIYLFIIYLLFILFLFNFFILGARTPLTTMEKN
jgi:hypothetical protein